MSTPMDLVIILGERRSRASLTQDQKDRLAKRGILSVEDEKELRDEVFRMTVAREHANAPLPEWVRAGMMRGWMLIREPIEEHTLRLVEATPTDPEVEQAEEEQVEEQAEEEQPEEQAEKPKTRRRSR